MREAVILAAGIGRRLHPLSGGKPKFLVELLEFPLVAYPLATLKNLGVSRITMVVPAGWSAEASKILDKLGFEKCLVENNEVERENGYSLALAEPCVNSEVFIVSMCDHIYVPRLPKCVVERFYVDEPDLVVGGDPAPRFVDIDEATKIVADEYGNIIAIGKGLQGYTHIDTGVFVMKRSVLRVARRLADFRPIVKLSDVVGYLRKTGLRAVVADARGIPWTEIDTAEDFQDVVSGNRRAVLEEVLSIVRRCLR